MDELREELDKVINDLGEAVALRVLRNVKPSSEKVLTIIVDDTMHKIPQEELVGDVYVFSSGVFAVNTSALIEDYLSVRLRLLASKLREENWSRIRIIFSGHALLAAQVKLLTYRVTHLETEDVGFFGGNGYRSVKIEMRGGIIL